MHTSPHHNDYCIHAHGITLDYGQRRVLDQIDLNVRKGEIVTLLGPNGSGKTSLLKVLLGFITPQAGTIERAPDIRIGYVPQKITFAETLPMTVEWYLRLNANTKGEAVLRVADDVGIFHLLSRSVHVLSGGEMQRLLLARALLCIPDLLVLDEPVQGADVNGQAEIYNLIRRVRDEYGCGVLMVSHDLHLVMAATDRVLCLNHHICCHGHPSEISSHPEFIRMFGPGVAESLAIYVHHHTHTHGMSGNVVDCGHDHA